MGVSNHLFVCDRFLLVVVYAGKEDLRVILHRGGGGEGGGKPKGVSVDPSKLRFFSNQPKGEGARKETRNRIYKRGPGDSEVCAKMSRTKRRCQP